MDDFGVKYFGKEHARHLMYVLKLYYKMEEDWKRELYCGITLNWNYDEGYVDREQADLHRSEGLLAHD